LSGLSCALVLYGIEALMTKYPVLGLVDASVVALAERLKLRKLATTDRRHFSTVRPTHVPHLELVPKRPPSLYCFFQSSVISFQSKIDPSSASRASSTRSA
jgi:hypothetical protein